VGTADWVPTENALQLVDYDDSDTDTLPDWWEALYGGAVVGLDPGNADTDGNGTEDTWEDYDGDGLENRYEFLCRCNPFDSDTDDNGIPDSLEDLDHDGLDNGGEQRLLTDPTLTDTDDDGWSDSEEAQMMTSPRHPMSRPNFAYGSLDLSEGPLAGLKLPDTVDFQFGQGAWTIECWYYPTASNLTGDLFVYQGINGASFRLGLTNGSPIVEIYGSGGTIVRAGGEAAVPPLVTGVWTHVAASWAPAANSLRLYRDGFLLIAQPFLGRPVVAMGNAYVGRNLQTGYLDELRVWAEARTGDEIERWKHEIIPSFEIVDRGPFSGFIYGQMLQPPVEPPYPGSVYVYTDDNLLRLYYRFDDAGEFVEDFSRFLDRSVYVKGTITTNIAAPMRGVDDADGDLLPDWWVDLTRINNWRARYRGTAVDVRQDLDVDGASNIGWQAPPEGSGPWATPPPPNLWPRPRPDCGYIVRDFTCFSSIGGIVAQEENYQLVATKSRILHDSGIYAALYKLFVLPLAPKEALFHVRVDGGKINRMLVNEFEVPVTGTTTTNIASLLRRGRNRIYLIAEDTNGVMWSVTVTPPGTWLYNAGGDPPVIMDMPWPEQTYSWPAATMKIDSSLTVDGREIIVRGDSAKYDPRAVWHGRTCTDPQYLRADDMAGLFPEHLDYGIMNDPDGERLTNLEEFHTLGNPRDKDSNNNGIPDNEEDFDLDGLNNGREEEVGTDPRQWDTDDDGIPDANELALGADPIDGNSPLVFRAVAFGGSGYVEFPRQRRFALHKWTIEANIRPEVGGGTILERTVGRNLINYGLRLTSSNTVQAYFTDINGLPVMAESRPIPVDGTNWTHVAATYETTNVTLRLYINAVLETSVSTGRVPVTYGPGGATVRAGEGYRGLIDEVRFWSAALTQAQIADRWRSTLSGSESNLVAYYRFDDGGLTAQDSVLRARGDWLNGWENAAVLVDPIFTNLPPEVIQTQLSYDSDGDGLPDWWEVQYGLDPFDPSGDNGAYGDPDGDGLWNINEYRAGLNPRKASTFDDSVLDGDRDSDGDGLSNRYEQDSSGSRIDMVDTDDDGLTDWEEVTGLRVAPAWTPSTNAHHILYVPASVGGPGRISSPIRSLDPPQQRAAVFGGDGCMVVSNQDRHALISWSLQAWVWPSNALSDGVIIRRRVENPVVGGTAINYELGVRSDGGVLRPYTLYAGFVPGSSTALVVQVDGTGANEIRGGALTTVEIPPAQWSHIAATYDNEAHVLSLYINGELAAYRRDAFMPWGVGVIEGSNYVADLTIGGARSGTGAVVDGFEGCIDEVMISGGAMRAEKVKESVTSGITVRSALRGTITAPAAALIQLPVSEALKYEHKPNEILVRYKATVAPKDVPALAASLGLNVARSYRTVPLYKMTITDGSSITQKLAQVRANPSVLYAEPNFKVFTFRTPNDPLFDRLWGLKNTGQTGGTLGSDIGAPEAWDRVTGDRKVVVADIDSGIDYTHSDLAGNMWINSGEIPGNNVDDDGNGYVDDIYGYNFFDGTGDPMDDLGHGTHVAGTIGAVGNNGVGVVGVNWQVSLMALKFISAMGYGFIDDVIAAIDYAVQQKVRISNNSWGAYGYSQALYDAIASARNANHLFVAAAGNAGVDIDEVPEIPAGYDLDNIVSVAASDANDRLANFSNFGRKNVDLAAPGVGIYSTLPGNRYGSLDGTSMAAPHVAGVAALLLARYPGLRYDAVKQIILNSVELLDAFKTNTVSGGRLSAAGAIAGAGLVLAYFPFDDGGSTYDEAGGYYNKIGTAEDFTMANDWDEGWAHAGRFVGNCGFVTNRFFLSTTDSNFDGIPDWWCVAYGFDPSGAPIADLDPDRDGLSNYYEFLAGTHPRMADSDGNGVSDADEDLDGDGLTNRQEQEQKTNPLMADTDDDGLSDAQEVTVGTDALSAYDPEVRRAMWFRDGTYRLKVRTETALSMVGDWTLEAWVRPDRMGESAVILRRAEMFPFGGFRRIDYELGLTNGVPYVLYAFRQNGTQVIERVDAPWAIGTEWTHLAAVREAGDRQLRLLVNGKRVALKRPVAVPTQRAYGSFETVMGGGDLDPATGVARQGFTGWLDGVRIWNYARSGLEIQESREVLLPEFTSAGPDAIRAPTHLFNFDDGGVTAENSRYPQDWTNLWQHAAEVQGATPAAVGDYLVASAWPPLALDSDDDGLPDVVERTYNLQTQRSESPYIYRMLHFDGSAEAVVVVDELVDTNETACFALTNWTVEAWVRPQALHAGGRIPLVTRRTKAEGFITFELGLNNIGGLVMPYARFQRDDGGNEFSELSTAVQIPLGTNEQAWTHLTATFSATNQGRFTLYINGSEAIFATVQGAKPKVGGPGVLEFGAPGFEGDLHEIRVWRQPRTSAEIAENYRKVLLFSAGLLENVYKSGPSAYLGRPTTTNEDGYVYDHSYVAYYEGLPYIAGRKTHKFALEAWVKMERGARGGIIAERKVDIMLLPDQPDWRINHLLRVTDEGKPRCEWEGHLVIITPVYESNVVVRLDESVEIVTRNLTSEVDIRDGQWHHLAAVGDSYQVRLYIDGRLDAQSLSYYVFRARPAPLFESFYYTFPPIGSVLRVAGDTDPAERPEAEIDEVLFWNEDISVEDVRRHMQYGLTKSEIRRGLAEIRPIPEGAVDTGTSHQRLVSYVTFDGVIAPPWVVDVANRAIQYRMLPLPNGGEIGENARSPVVVDRLRVYHDLMAGYFAAVDGGQTVENYMERNDQGYAGLMGAGVSMAPYVLADSGGHIDADADGDGMPDWWEMFYGFNPSAASNQENPGEDAYGDPDEDGLANIQEFLAGTHPLNSDSDNDGNNDFYSWLTTGLYRYRIFGELYTDFDGMSDLWETRFGLNPRIYDAHLDNDGDGWCNRSEFLAGMQGLGRGEVPTSPGPNDRRSYPRPALRVRFEYNGSNPQGNIVVLAYSTPTMDGEPDAVGTSGEAADIPWQWLSDVAADGMIFEGVLTAVPVVPNSVRIGIGANYGQEIIYEDTGDGVLRSINITPVRFGQIDYQTGQFTITTAPRRFGPPASIWGQWSVFVDAGNYPFEGPLTFVKGALREGPTWMFAFIDYEPRNGQWDPGEPAALAENQPVNISWGEIKDVVFGLVHSQPRHDAPTGDYALAGYGRFAWTNYGNSSCRVYVRDTRTGAEILQREIRGPRNWFHEGDYRLAGIAGLPYSGTYQWFVYITNQTAPYASGSFTVSYPTSHPAPVPKTPQGSVFRYAKNELQWYSLDASDTEFLVQIGRDPSFSSLVYSGRIVAPFREKEGTNWLHRWTLPIYAGDKDFTNGVYYWRVRGINPEMWSSFSPVRSFAVDLTDRADGPRSIAGTIYYPGKVTNANWVVQAYDSPGFGGLPLAQVTVANTAGAAGWPLNRVGFVLRGLMNGSYYVRAFLDQNGNGQPDPWETQGFARGSSFCQAVAVAAVPQGSQGPCKVYTMFADTDNDRIPDDWEYQYTGGLTSMGPGPVRGYTDSNGDDVNDYEHYASAPMNSSPVVEDSLGEDGIPFRIKTILGLGAEPIEFEIDNIRLDERRCPVVKWKAVPAGTARIDGAGRAVKAGGGVEIGYQMQYSTNFAVWNDVNGGGALFYDSTNDAFQFVHTNKPPSRGFYRYKVFWR